MRNLTWLIAAALTFGVAAGDATAAGKPYKAPRNAAGQPDFQGIWTNTALTFLVRPPIFKNLVATDAEEAMMLAGFKQMAGEIISNAPIDPNRPAPPVVKEAPQADFIEMDLHLAVINGQKRSSWIVEPADGKVPFTEEGRKANRALMIDSYEGPEVRPMTERCITAIGAPEGPPMMNTGFNAHYQFVQTRDHVAISIEMNHDVRIVRLADRAHPPAAVRKWMGDSVGWWEGDTLVVETTNLDPRMRVAGMSGGFPHGPNTRITERFTRTAKDQILYQFTIEDTGYYTQAWRGEMPMRAAQGPMYEYACHEGNYSVANALTGARYEEQEAAKAAAAAKPAASPVGTPDLHATHTATR